MTTELEDLLADALREELHYVSALEGNPGDGSLKALAAYDKAKAEPDYPDAHDIPPMWNQQITCVTGDGKHVIGDGSNAATEWIPDSGVEQESNRDMIARLEKECAILRKKVAASTPEIAIATAYLCAEDAKQKEIDALKAENEKLAKENMELSQIINDRHKDLYDAWGVANHNSTLRMLAEKKLKDAETRLAALTSDAAVDAAIHVINEEMNYVTKRDVLAALTAARDATGAEIP